ncbi:MAG TPA: ABC transporter permease [Gemmatimonadales bacterium]|jgi:simple sugar transport system permease protein
MNAALAVAFGTASIRVATPLVLAAIGEAIAERSGVINLGIEGGMLAGAFAAAVGATHGGLMAGVVAGTLAGIVVAFVFGAIAVWGRTDQIISGMAVTLAATGLTGLLARRVWGVAGAGLSIPTMKAIAVPALATIPIVGPIFFNQPAITYLAYLMIPLAGWLLFRSRFGLEVRASGEGPAAAAACGVAVARVRITAVVIGGLCAGLAGASLVLAEVGTFSEQMTAGRGFIAIAIVALGRWNPVGIAVASLVFGAATATQYLFQAAGTSVPYQLFLVLPYLLALAVMAIATRRHGGPAGLGQTH